MSFPIKNGGSFHSYVSLPEGIPSIFELPGRAGEDGSCTTSASFLLCTSSHPAIWCSPDYPAVDPYKDDHIISYLTHTHIYIYIHIICEDDTSKIVYAYVYMCDI